MPGSYLQGFYNTPTWVEMAGNGDLRAYPNVMALVRNESPSDALAAMLASCPPVGLPG